MAEKTNLDNARAAYQRAVEEAQKYGDEATEAFQKAELYDSSESRELFHKKAKRALVAYENWRKSAELALEVLSEIESRT